MEYFKPESISCEGIEYAVEINEDAVYLCDEEVKHEFIQYYNGIISDIIQMAKETPFNRNRSIEQELLTQFPILEDLRNTYCDPEKIRFYEIQDKASILYYEYKSDEKYSMTNIRHIVLESKHDDIIAVGLMGSHPEIATKRFSYINSDGSGYFQIDPNIDDPQSLLVSLLTTFILFCTDTPH